MSVAGLLVCWLADKIPRSPEVVSVADVCPVVASRLEWSLVAGAVLLALSVEVALPLVGRLWLVGGLALGGMAAAQRALAL